MTSNTPLKRQKRGGLALFQLLIVAGLLAAVWLSFGKNVLAPQNQSGMPQQLGNMGLVSTTEGAEALAQISQLHGTNVGLVNAYIAEYTHTSPYHNARATVWIGEAASKEAAAELTTRMANGIQRGGSGFNNLSRLNIDGSEVFQVDGPGGQHFFYTSKKTENLVIWLSLEAVEDVLSTLEQALKLF